ncbi:hypothetical protein GIB67_036912 [Kingdonia uniflora]|uniref:GH18 domain-containing protein n=1 Tax=Kingdonia uniflora TaxID=39325 RepID=A0A7J7NWB2_9MAGN|nr:hypothetical protein GIB67_036912 [Kingdonia uniflora]
MIVFHLTISSTVSIAQAPYSLPGGSPKPSLSPPFRVIKCAYWPSFDGFPLTSIDTSYFTHLYYAFLLPDPNTYNLAITALDEEMLPLFVSTLRAKKPLVKTILSIGGAGNDPKVFSAIVNANSTRSTFIESAIEVARTYGFDGLDLDWEFPLNQQDMINLGILYKEWWKALKIEAKATGRTRLLLSSAVYYASTVFKYSPSPKYPGESIRKYVDWVSPMCFDFYGSWDMVTGQPAALYDPTSNISTSYGIHSWIDAGVPPNKIVMGLPLYGHSWKLKDPLVHGVGAPTTGAGGPNNGNMIYSAIVDFNRGQNATVVYDGKTVSTYSYVGDMWIGYDDGRSVTKKVEFARVNGLRGYFFWALGQDKDWSLSNQEDTKTERLNASNCHKSASHLPSVLPFEPAPPGEHIGSSSSAAQTQGVFTLQDVGSKLQILTVNMGEVKTRLGDIDTRLGAIDTRLGVVETKVQSLR